MARHTRKKGKHHAPTPKAPEKSEPGSSFPTLLLIVVIALIVLALFLLLSDNPSSGQEQPSEIIQTISSTDDGFVRQDQLDSLALADFDSKYTEIKQEKGIQSEFYVFFEDEDGQIVPVDGKRCFGSPMATEVDPRCG